MQNNYSIPFAGAPETCLTGRNIKISSIQYNRDSEHSLCDEVERLQLAIDSLKSGTWTFDFSTNALVVCTRCRELIPALNGRGIKESELMALVPREYSQGVAESFYLALQTYAPFDIEVPFAAANKHCLKWFRVTGACALGRSDLLPKIHGSIEDISERKRLELLKQDYLAIVNHDLQTPLSVMKMYIQLCLREADMTGNPLIQELLKKAELQSGKMGKMIDRYLESPAVIAGDGSSLESFDIKKLFEEMIADLRLLHPDRFLWLKPVAEMLVFADREKISQVIQNLLGNAIKYSSEKDKVTIDFNMKKNYVQVEIQDHGIGIKPADQKKIFGRFYRVEQVSNKLVEGYGIGLYLTKQIIEQHHGRIWVASELNKGSRFYFTLPCSCSGKDSY